MLIRAYNYIKDLSEASRNICRICPSSTTLDHSELLSNSILHVPGRLQYLYFRIFLLRISVLLTTAQQHQWPQAQWLATSTWISMFPSDLRSVFNIDIEHQGHHTEESSSVEVEAEVVHYLSGPFKTLIENLTKIPYKIAYSFGGSLDLFVYFWPNPTKKLGRFLQQKPSSFSLKKILRSIPGLADWMVSSTLTTASAPSGTDEPVVIYRTCPGKPIRWVRWVPCGHQQPHWSWHEHCDTVDGRNPAPPEMYNTL